MGFYTGLCFILLYINSFVSGNLFLTQIVALHKFIRKLAKALAHMKNLKYKVTFNHNWTSVSKRKGKLSMCFPTFYTHFAFLIMALVDAFWSIFWKNKKSIILALTWINFKSNTWLTEFITFIFFIWNYCYSWKLPFYIAVLLLSERFHSAAFLRNSYCSNAVWQ